MISTNHVIFSIDVQIGRRQAFFAISMISAALGPRTPPVAATGTYPIFLNLHLNNPVPTIIGPGGSSYVLKTNDYCAARKPVSLAALQQR